MDGSFPHKTDLASYYKNFLALELFVGRVFAYFLMHKVSLTEIPTVSQIFLMTNSPQHPKGRALLHFINIIKHAYVSEHICLCKLIEGELIFIC